MVAVVEVVLVVIMTVVAITAIVIMVVEVVTVIVLVVICNSQVHSSSLYSVLYIYQKTPKKAQVDVSLRVPAKNRRRVQKR